MSTLGNSLNLGISPDGRVIVLGPDARARHLYIVGSTGTGKSKLLESSVRQDILAWPNHGCGLALLDPDGKLFDDVMRFVAAHDLSYWPIIPLDLRRFDTTIAYNPLRQRAGTEPAVVVAAVVEAILSGWNQPTSNETPRLAKWLTSTLRLLYESGLTLIEALQIVSNPELRRQMTCCVEDVVARAVWEASAHLKENEFQAEVESMMNRLRRFLSTQVIRASLCQPDVSLDLSNVIEKGQILLVSLATAGGQISDEDATTFGSLLLSDLWVAATTRGKRDGLRPFYVYADEFQRFMTPSVAESFDRARGYGVHYTIAHQFPSQLALRGETGQRVLQSVLANARTKVVFQLSHAEDLQTLGLMLGRQRIDPDEIKYQGSATRVVGHEIQYLPSFTESQTTSETNGVSESESISQTESDSTNWSQSAIETYGASLTNSTGTGTSHTHGKGNGTIDTHSQSQSHQESKSISDGDATGKTWSKGKTKSNGGNKGKSRTTTASYNLGGGADRLDDKDRKKLGTNRPRPNYHALLDHQNGYGKCDSELDGLTKNVAISEALGTTEGKNHSQSNTDSHGGSESHNHQESHSSSDGVTFGESTSKSENETESDTASKNQSLSLGTSVSTGNQLTFGGTHASSESFGVTVGQMHSKTESTSTGTTDSPHLIPILGQELLPPVFRSIDEEVFRWTKLIDALPSRHALIRVVDQPLPQVIVTQNLRTPLTTQSWIERWTKRRLGEIPFALPLPEAVRRVAERQSAFPKFVEQRQAKFFPEPLSTRRKL